MEKLAGLYMLIVSMVASPMTNERDYFFFYEPLFQTMNECIYWTNRYPSVWMPKVYEAYPEGQVETALCISVDKMKELMKEQQKEEGLGA